MALQFKQITGITPSTDTPLHTVTASFNGIFDITCCNRSSTSVAKIRVGVTVSATTTYYFYDLVLEASASGGVTSVELSGKKFPPGATIFVRSDITDVDFTLDGIEEAV